MQNVTRQAMPSTPNLFWWSERQLIQAQNLTLGKWSSRQVITCQHNDRYNVCYVIHVKHAANLSSM